MAKVFPFQAYRYSERAGLLDRLLTQPYDKITPEMRERYLEASPHNLVRIELGKRCPEDDGRNNVYTRAAALLNEWIGCGILAHDEKPAFYPYFQEFEHPETGERLTRKGFIGLGAVEDYSQGAVFRHEQTLSAPKQDRMELLRHTRAHTGQLFMLYDDRYGEVDRMIEAAAAGPPVGSARDEYGVVHTLWRIQDKDTVGCVQRAMVDKKLLIADGHHRYETALTFSRENPGLADAGRVMMTFVNLQSPGLRILATHRLVQGLAGFSREGFLGRANEAFRVEPLDSVEALQAKWREPHPGLSRAGVALGGGVWLLEMPRPEGMLDVALVHEHLLGGVLRIGEADVRDQRFIRYIRGVAPAVEEVRSGRAQLAILLEPTPVEAVAGIAFNGGVLPQKSTDFYPKLLSGMTIYRLEK